MPAFQDVLLGVLIGAVVTWLLVRSRYAAEVAGARAESTLLRERVEDLAQAHDEDSDTARLVSALHESMVRVERQVHTLERDRGAQFSAVAGELAAVQAAACDLRDQTATLAGSLRSSTVRGQWGEVQLRRVLELAGLLSRCDFDTQVSGHNRHGVPVRPDVVVHLPGGKHVVVDAKAPLTHVLSAAHDGADRAEQEQLWAAHAKALRTHVATLAGKDYWSMLPDTPEFVICFVPSEAIVAHALAADGQLHEFALSQGVVLTSPASLLALLRTVAYTWQQEAVTESARELLSLGRELAERIGTLGKHADAMGRSLDRAVDAYNSMVGSLERRVLVTARRLTELGLSVDSPPEPPALATRPRSLSAVEFAPDDAPSPEPGAQPKRRVG